MTETKTQENNNIEVASHKNNKNEFCWMPWHRRCLTRSLTSSLRELCLDDSDVTDDGITSVAEARLTSLEILSLCHCRRVTQRGIQRLGVINQLTAVGLQHTDVGGADVLALSTMPYLSALRLDGCQNVSDTGLQYLVHSKSLSNLSLLGCNRVTAHGVRQLPERVTISR